MFQTQKTPCNLVELYQWLSRTDQRGLVVSTVDQLGFQSDTQACHYSQSEIGMFNCNWDNSAALENVLKLIAIQLMAILYT